MRRFSGRVYNRVLRMKVEGYEFSDICQELKLSPATVAQMILQAQIDGDLKELEQSSSWMPSFASLVRGFGNVQCSQTPGGAFIATVGSHSGKEQSTPKKALESAFRFATAEAATGPTGIRRKTPTLPNACR